MRQSKGKVDMNIKIQKLHDDVKLPEYKTTGSSGADVYAYLPAGDTVIYVQEICKIPTGWKVEIPKGYELQVRSRSGLASKGVAVVNSPGTIDSDFRGEVNIILINHGSSYREIRHGDRIAQIVLKSIEPVLWEEVDKLRDSQRGEGGFGHTGR